MLVGDEGISPPALVAAGAFSLELFPSVNAIGARLLGMRNYKYPKLFVGPSQVGHSI